MPVVAARVLLQLSQSCRHPEGLAKCHYHSRPKTEQASGRSQELPSNFASPCPAQYKLLELLLLFRLEPVVYPQLPNQQDGFRSGRSTFQQVVKPASDIEESYEGRRKVDLVLVDLTAACDTVWHRGLAVKLL